MFYAIVIFFTIYEAIMISTSAVKVLFCHYWCLYCLLFFGLALISGPEVRVPCFPKASGTSISFPVPPLTPMTRLRSLSSGPFIPTPHVFLSQINTSKKYDLYPIITCETGLWHLVKFDSFVMQIFFYSTLDLFFTLVLWSLREVYSNPQLELCICLLLSSVLSIWLHVFEAGVIRCIQIKHCTDTSVIMKCPSLFQKILLPKST